MAEDYKQYTTCGPSSTWVPLWLFLSITTAVLVAGAVAAIVLAGWCALFYLPVLAAAETVAAADWWLHVRLVCLGGDESAIGMLVSVEPSRGKNEGFLGNLDTDYSINLLLFPNLPGVNQADAEVSVPYGRLIKDQNVPALSPFFRGETARELPEKTGRESAVLHAEFEGAGMYDWYIGATIALALALAALFACALIPPPWGVIVAAILAFLAFLAWLISHEIGTSDYADPTETKGTPAVFHVNDPDPPRLGADLLYVRGTWVFDSFHEGWNELHPIKKCTFVGKWDGAWPADIPTIKTKLDDGFDDAADPATLDRQRDPQYQWEVHPLIDGCLVVEDPGVHPVGGGPH